MTGASTTQDDVDRDVQRLLDEREAQGLPRDRFTPAAAETIASILRDAEGGGGDG